MSLYAELKRRNVFRVAAAYVVVGWLLLQVSDVVLGFIGAPEWVGKALIALLLLGLVPSLAIAWIFEVGPSGIHRDDGQPDPTAGAHARRLDYITLFALVVVALMVMAEQLRMPEKAPAARNVGDARPTASDASNVPAPVPLPPSIPRASVAVLPFTNMSPDPENEYFADGIAEELLNVLSRVDGLKVASRTSAFSFKGKHKAVAEIAGALKVAHVLEGSVRKQGPRVRITVQLIDARTDQHLWSETYDRELTDIFAVQEEIAHAITSALSGALGVTAPTPLEVATPTADLKAYELYLRGRQLYYQRGNALIAARDLLEEATQRDAEFAEAWAVLAAVQYVSPGYVFAYTGETLDRSYANARRTAKRAIDLDPGLALPYAVLARVEMETGNPLQSERLLREALRLDPNDSTAWLWQGLHFLSVGKVSQAAPALRRAVEIDPLTGINHGWLAVAQRFGGEREAAEAGLRRAFELGWTDAHWMRARFELADGDSRGAIKEFRSYFESLPNSEPNTRAVFEALYRAVEDPANRPALLDAVRADRHGLNGASWSGTLALLGMPNEAVAVAMDPDLPKSTAYLYRDVWYPTARALLVAPAFLKLAERDGLLAYWREEGFPDGCRLVDTPPAHLECTGVWQ